MDILRGIIDDTRLYNVLLAGTYVSDEDIKTALALVSQKHTSFAEALISSGFLTKDILGQVTAEALGLKYVDADSLPSTREHVQKIPEAVGRLYQIVLVETSGTNVVLASSVPQKDGIAAAVATLFPGSTVEIRYTLPEFIDEALKLYEKSLDVQFNELFQNSAASIPDIVDTIFAHAKDTGVSDIHFEPRASHVLVRFRIDGILLEMGRIPKPFYEKILNRIKVMAQLPIDEHLRATDGSLRYEHKDKVVNIRVSIAPTVAGEKIAMRLLSAYFGFAVEKLGLTEQNRKILTEAANKPFGMILVTGPTGSGKTTTLYSFLSTLNKPEVNITTIEDPVEYRLEGLNQMQTNDLMGLTFARGLRTIVRQDPDVVLVGEIRDKETAEISINAALTGHLLLSTFHSNDAATTIPRLLDMGIEPFLLSSTLELIVAQRLARKICDNCRTTYTMGNEEIQKYSPEVRAYLSTGDAMTLFKGKGCEACRMTGYRGRTGIFEMIRVTPEIQDLIVKHPKSSDIWKLASSQGSRPLFDDGFEKVKQGETTLEELLRVAEPAHASA